MGSSIGTIITYCTNDFRFISKCIEEAKVFSKEIIIPVCDHFFDGTPENRRILDQTYATHPDCVFIEFSYLPDRLYSQYHKLKPDDKDWAAFWAATTRYIGFQYLDPSTEYVLFIDSDEICEGEKFLAWHESAVDRAFDAMRLGSYYYSISPRERSKLKVNLPLFVKKDRFAPLTLFNGLERIGAYATHTGPKREFILGEDEKPLFHHYSWTRSKEECLHKCKTWSHRTEQDWSKAIDDAFSGKSKEALFGPTHEFETILHPYFDPFSVPLPKLDAKGPFDNVIKINEKDLFRKEIENELV